MRWPWRRREPERNDGRHAPPDLERASAELLGKLEMLTDSLERVICDREDELRGRDDE